MPGCRRAIAGGSCDRRQPHQRSRPDDVGAGGFLIPGLRFAHVSLSFPQRSHGEQPIRILSVALENFLKRGFRFTVRLPGQVDISNLQVHERQRRGSSL